MSCGKTFIKANKTRLVKKLGKIEKKHINQVKDILKEMLID